MGTIVAEALIEVADPLAADLDPGALRPAHEVVDLLRGALAPIEAGVAGPDWLRPDQVAPFRRVIAALDRHGAALLADPVGSGKTYIALAVARQLNGARPPVAIVPAALIPQWSAIASRLGVQLQLWSHERLSRGQVPPSAGAVIVDESHRFRNPGTVRYRTLARWLQHRPLLLMSATPVVNRLDDLAHQLLLGLRSDALALEGVTDILEQLRHQGSHPALGRVVLCRPAPVDRPIARQQFEFAAPPAELPEMLERVDRMRFSTSAGVAALIRVTLLRALGSSVTAFASALERYRGLLQHGAAAAAGGRAVTRSDIRRFASATLDQMVMWELVAGDGAGADLVLEDIPELDTLITLARSISDPRFARLQGLLADGEPTIVFTASRDTLKSLRQLPWPRPCAWVSGDAAGIGNYRVPAPDVLALFQPEPAVPLPLPAVLLATDIAAEGLNLQRARRLVHFDLPWTPMRLDQREGRAIRLGQRSESVTVIQWQPWSALERRLRQVERLVQKRHRIARAGIDASEEWLFRWRSRFHSRPREGAAVAAVWGAPPGWLVAVALDHLDEGTVRPAPADLLWLADDGTLSDDPRITVPLLDRMPMLECADHAELELPRERIADWIRKRLRAANSSLWSSAAADGQPRQLIRRLQHLAREAGRRRRRAGIELAEEAIATLGGGLTAGESLLVPELMALPLEQLRRRLTALRFRPRHRPVGVPRLIGAVRIEPDPSRG